MSCRQHGYPWSSLATSPCYSSPQEGLQGYILCPHIAAVCKFELVRPAFAWPYAGVHRSTSPYELVLASPAVSCVSGSSNLYSVSRWEAIGRIVGVLWGVVTRTCSILLSIYIYIYIYISRFSCKHVFLEWEKDLVCRFHFMEECFSKTKRIVTWHAPNFHIHISLSTV